MQVEELFSDLNVREAAIVAGRESHEDAEVLSSIDFSVQIVLHPRATQAPSEWKMAHFKGRLWEFMQNCLRRDVSLYSCNPDALAPEFPATREKRSQNRPRGSA
jgi:hypothetical protein